jgi:ligand-binding sensor domain-containing protein
VLVFSSSLIYFLGKNGNLYKTDTAGNWSKINLPERLAFSNETRLFKDLNNDLWIFGKKEVARLNSNGTSWTSFFSNTGFKNNVTIRSMAVDNNNVLWTIGDGVLKKEKETIKSSVSFTSLAFAPGNNRIWATSPDRALYYVNSNSTQLNTVANNAIAGGGDDIKIAPNGDFYLTTSTGIVRANASGTSVGSYTAANTNGLIGGRPTTFDFDGENNLWVLFSGHLYKMPINKSAEIKKYSFNSDLSNLSWISVLNLSSTDSDILLSKTSGNAAIKIR